MTLSLQPVPNLFRVHIYIAKARTLVLLKCGSVKLKFASPFILSHISLLIFFTFFIHHSSFAQQFDSSKIFNDTASIQNVTVTAFAASAKWKDVPAAIAVINKKDLERFDNTSLVPVLNTVAGVRMEERSPGSYRLSIRGSLLRSPFGVRNIKVYWNDIPFTDAGGNTYLNLIDINQLQSIEITKGPASSLYGANTGGALFIHISQNNLLTAQNNFNVGLSAGSYGLFNEQTEWNYKQKNFHSNLSQSHIQSDGYRQQSALRRDAIKWNTDFKLNDKENLSTIFFYTDLHYETPGAITQSQMDSLPTLARQPTATLPGSVVQHAGVYNKTVFGGITLKSEFNSHFNNTTSVLLNHTDFKNPFITNYEKRNELNYGARAVFDYHTEKNNSSFHWLNGIEWLQNHSHINNYDNNGGTAGDIQYKDELYATQYFFFTQAILSLHNKFIIQTGLSANQQRLKYVRLSDSVYTNEQHQNTNIFLAPRLSLLYKIANNVSLYAIAARGFSPPTLAEVRPSTNSFYDLQPEYGWNFEAGVKGFILKSKFEFDVSAYSFHLKNAIVRRTDSTGAEYFTNSGGTKQNGVEAWLKATIITNSNGFIHTLSIANSFAYQPYKFNAYIVGDKNFSGNRVTGVPQIINVSQLNVNTNLNIYCNITLNCTSSIPLTDANDIVANDYQLLQIKLGYAKQYKKIGIDVFAFLDNALNQLYSLGNDINSFGGRYFNPAPAGNFQAGIKINF